MVGVLENPHANSATPGVVQMRVAIDVEEDLLCDIFGFGRVA